MRARSHNASHRLLWPAKFCDCQADAGIRDSSVTGVQTCALPICCLCMHVSLLVYLCVCVLTCVCVCVSVCVSVVHPVLSYSSFIDTTSGQTRLQARYAVHTCIVFVFYFILV